LAKIVLTIEADIDKDNLKDRLSQGYSKYELLQNYERHLRFSDANCILVSLDYSIAHIELQDD
jgi:hypothetical protein